MNERILKLVEQAKRYAWENETHWSANAEREALFEQKFAELLVKECFVKLTPYLDDQFIDDIESELKEHFGVE